MRELSNIIFCKTRCADRNSAVYVVSGSPPLPEIVADHTACMYHDLGILREQNTFGIFQLGGTSKSFRKYCQRHNGPRCRKAVVLSGFTSFLSPSMSLTFSLRYSSRSSNLAPRSKVGLQVASLLYHTALTCPIGTIS